MSLPALGYALPAIRQNIAAPRPFDCGVRLRPLLLRLPTLAKSQTPAAGIA